MHNLLQVYVLHSVLHKHINYIKESSLSQPFLQKSLEGSRAEYFLLQI